MSTKIHIVNFGQSNGGLTTVGYTLLNVDGTELASRSTTGVIEYGTSTGIYGANLVYDDTQQLVVLWDTGEDTPKYAVEENRTVLATIQEGSDFNRMIWNSMRNQGELYNKLLKALHRLEDARCYDDEFQKILNKIETLINREIVQIKDIKEALNITVNPTPVYRKSNDESKSLKKIEKLIEDLENIKDSIHKQNPNNNMRIVNDNIKKVGVVLSQLVDTMPKDDLLTVIKENLEQVKKQENKDRLSRLKNALRV